MIDARTLPITSCSAQLSSILHYVIRDASLAASSTIFFLLQLVWPIPGVRVLCPLMSYIWTQRAQSTHLTLPNIAHLRVCCCFEKESTREAPSTSFYSPRISYASVLFRFTGVPTCRVSLSLAQLPHCNQLRRCSPLQTRCPPVW